MRKLLDRFREEKVFYSQFEFGRALVAANDRRAIPELEAWLTHADRHVRGNVAFVLGRLGDARGFETIAQILADRTLLSPGQGVATGSWTVRAQIRADRYDAAHLLGDLKDPRGVELLIPLLNDEVHALERLNAREALPTLRALLQDKRRSNFAERVTVAEAAKRAIAIISQRR